MFTVFGANGNTGSVVARRLLDSGKKVRLVVRDPNKVAALRSRGAEVVTGDVTDASAVKSALAGAEGAYLLVPPDNKSNDLVGRGRRIVDNYLAGLTAAKVPQAVMLSAIREPPAFGDGPDRDRALRRDDAPESGRHQVHVRARRVLHGEHPRLCIPDEAGRRAARPRRWGESSIPDDRDARHRRRRCRRAARAARCDAVDRIVGAAGVQLRRRGGGRIEDSRPYREGVSCAARCGGVDADEARVLGERRGTLSRDDRRVRYWPRVRGQGPCGAREGSPRRRAAGRSRLSRRLRNRATS